MSATWRSGDEPPAAGPVTLAGWGRVLCRGLPLGIVVFGCLGLLLLIRLIEGPLFGLRRPLTPWITRFVCITAFVLMGIRRSVRGRAMGHRGAFVANHSSWLDIFALNASSRLYFVSKAEVAGWPGIGWLARATGTVFIRRDRREAHAQTGEFVRRLEAGQKLLFFPEGTSTDGRQVLPFKTTLFQAFLSPELKDILQIQPVTVVYTAPAGADPRFYGWWGDMDFASHLLKVLAAPRQGSVEVIYHTPLSVAQAGDRKALAAACEAAVRSGLTENAGLPPAV
ncbi:lysophospholipid acyltransferase family protein [Tropicimonas sp.]|uniref:lysophospholipid acyltransferase family protein n=1 Tax=Tropicimonas sp. TaxID=2067044 RepID=UPI003A8A5F95